jgi:uncharacterized protein YPO0396
VYYRIPATVLAGSRPPPSGPPGGTADPLYGKLQLKPDSPFYDWLERELWRRADHHCAVTTAEFRRCEKAVTRAGQVRSGQRHEKNDDRPIGERRGFVLGWSPEAKIDSLLAQAQSVQRQLAAVAQRLVQAQAASKAANERGSLLARLAEFDTWDDVDWARVAVQISRLEAERRHLEQSSQDLARVTAELSAVHDDVGARDRERAACQEELGAARGELDQVRRQAEAARDRLAEPDAEAARSRFAALAALALKDGVPAQPSLAPRHYEHWQATTAKRLTDRLERAAEQQRP